MTHDHRPLLEGFAGPRRRKRHYMRHVVFIITVALVIPMVAFAGYPPDVEKGIVERAMDGQTKIFARDYPGAMEVFRALENDFPNHPIGYFGQMAVLEMRMLELEDFHLADEFEAMVKRGKKAVVKTMGRRPSDFDLLVCGSLEGLVGFYKARGRHWWDAYTQGVKSRQAFRRIKRRNPNFVDADFGLGMYLYWRSVFTRDLKFLPFFGDRRAEGIAVVERVAKDGHFAKDLADVNLAMIWMEERKFAKAHAIFKKYSDRYPNNVLLYMFDARTLIALKRYDEAVEALHKLLMVEPSIVKAHYFIGLARVLQKNPEHYPEAEKELKTFVTASPTGEWKASSTYWLGRLEELKGNRARAKAYYEEALVYNPNLKKLKLRIRGLGSGL